MKPPVETERAAVGARRFRKKPIVIEAMQFTEETKNQVFNWVWSRDPDFEDGKPVLRIHTLEGTMTARLGDWVIKGVKGEFYPCKPEIFEALYDADHPPSAPLPEGAPAKEET